MNNQTAVNCDLDENYCNHKSNEQITFSAALIKRLITPSKSEESTAREQ